MVSIRGLSGFPNDIPITFFNKAIRKTHNFVNFPFSAGECDNSPTCDIFLVSAHNLISPLANRCRGEPASTLAVALKKTKRRECKK